jgi:hypothetical protein
MKVALLIIVASIIFANESFCGQDLGRDAEINYIASIITGLAALAGVAISQFFSWIMKKNEFNNQVKMKRIDLGIEFEKRNLIEPVMMFLTSELKLITAIFQKGLEVEKTVIQRNLGEHILDMAMTSARLGAYGNKALIDKFEEFTRIRISVGFEVSEKFKNLPSAHERLKQAEILASEIIVHLKNKLESFTI